ncbi:MAG: ABC transporter permease [Lachnospiraceae bacterium]|jgi:simple sugar transport system permease protein
MKFFNFLKDKHANELVLFAIFAALFIIMSILSPDTFLSWPNIQNMMFQMPEFGLMALSMMVVILTGGMNLSICKGAMLAAIIAALIMRGPLGQSSPVLATIVGVVVILVVSILTGVLNGYVIGYIGVVAMLVTISTQMIFDGAGLIITKGNSIGGLPEPFLAIGSLTLGPIPVTMILYIVMIVISYYVMERSKWGREVYMIGDNEVATRFSGINTKKVIMSVYVLSGVLYGLAGVLITSRYCSAKTDYGSSYLMNSITAVVMGGTDINGGSGSVAGTILSVLILQTVSNGFTIFRVDQNLVNLFTGLILIFVLAVRYLTGEVQKRKKIKARMLAAAKAE